MASIQCYHIFRQAATSAAIGARLHAGRELRHPRPGLIVSRLSRPHTRELGCCLAKISGCVTTRRGGSSRRGTGCGLGGGCAAHRRLAVLHGGRLALLSTGEVDGEVARGRLGGEALGVLDQIRPIRLGQPAMLVAEQVERIRIGPPGSGEL